MHTGCTLACDTKSTLVPCTWDRDAHCTTSEQTVAISFCNNKFMESGEQCDASAIHTPTSSCCSDFTVTYSMAIMWILRAEPSAVTVLWQDWRSATTVRTRTVTWRPAKIDNKMLMIQTLYWRWDYILPKIAKFGGIWEESRRVYIIKRENEYFLHSTGTHDFFVLCWFCRLCAL